MNLGCLDDLTLGGPEEVIARDVQRIIYVGGSIPQHLKCELISNTDFQVSDATLKSFSYTSIADTSLLGALSRVYVVTTLHCVGLLCRPTCSKIY